jgi:hypothetical protein
MESEWSQLMLSGADNALFATAITIGVLQPEATDNISCIKAKPADAVAVNVRAPVAEAVILHVIAVCSDSTQKRRFQLHRLRHIR